MKHRFMLSLFLCLMVLPAIALAEIEVHFLDVGNADATIILADDYTIVIDGGESDSSQLIYSYLRNTLNIEHIDIVIATHPHSDHIGGLSAVFNACSVDRIYSAVPMYNQDGSLSYDSREFQSLVKYASKQDLSFTLPSAGEQIQLGSLTIEFINSGYEGNLSGFSNSQINNLSLIVRLVYGETSFLFSGDAEWDGEYLAVSSAGGELRSTIFHAGHHGSYTSSNTFFLQEVEPSYVIISCGIENEYGHPAPETLSRFQLLPVPVLRTDLSGTIICRSDGAEISFHTQDNTEIELIPEEKENDSSYYVGNRNSKRFHYPDCFSVSDMKEKNKVILPTREDAISNGYKPCGECQP